MRALDGKLRGVRGLIIDLRNNGGGEAELNQRVKVCSVKLMAQQQDEEGHEGARDGHPP